ncbi:MAG: hypothetical protein ACPG8W_09860 [Candidatus Promineifilaceae bacterium]
MNITIQPVTTVAQCHHVNNIERAAWIGIEFVPDHMLNAVAHEKGVVLLAYDGELPIGFCISFVSFVGNDLQDANFRMKHHSHLAAVLPAYQGKGVGAIIKQAQREAVLRQKIDLMTWTFDPLETKNARLNIHKLGAVCKTYKRNVYGMMTDALNAGILSDRFQVDWWLASEHVAARHSAEFIHKTRTDWESEGVRVVNSAEIENDHPSPTAFDPSLLTTQDTALLAVPSNFQTLKRANLQNAIDWRMHTRRVFESAFDQGFSATDLIHEPTLSYYLLERNWKS